MDSTRIKLEVEEFGMKCEVGKKVGNKVETWREKNHG